MPPSYSRGRTRNLLRCFCSRKPILAIFGVDDDGKVYVHQKTYKKDLIYNEIFVKPEPGTVINLCCRECSRWQEVVITRTSLQASLIEVDKPEAIEA